MNLFAPSKIPALKQKYERQGYSPIAHNGQTGADIYVNKAAQSVVRFGGDPAFDHFACFVMNNHAPYFPAITSHDCPDGPFVKVNGQWPQVTSVTEMEYLLPLPQEHYIEVNRWIADAWAARAKGQLAPTFNGLEHAFDALANEAYDQLLNNPDRKITAPDLKPDNIMIRPSTGQWVIIDGFS